MSFKTNWVIADAVLRGIIIAPTIAIWVVTCFLARRRNDPARVAFSYLKAIFPFFILWVVFSIAAAIVAIVRNAFEQSDSFDYETTSDIDTDNLLYKIIVRFNLVSELFQAIADILTVICLVELGNGFLFCLKQSQTKFQIVFRFLAIATGVVTFALSIAWFGLYNAQYSNYFNYLDGDDGTAIFDFDSFNHEIDIGDDLILAGDVILLAVALPSVFYAGYVLHQCRSAPILKNSAVLFVVATILNLLRRCWAIALDSWYVENVAVPTADNFVVDPIINVWADFVLFVLIFVIGRRKQGGLWSTPQPWIQQGVPPIQRLQPQPMIMQSQSGWQQPPPQQPLGYAAPAGLQAWQQAPVLVYSPSSAVQAPTNEHVHQMK